MVVHFRSWNNVFFQPSDINYSPLIQFKFDQTQSATMYFWENHYQFNSSGTILINESFLRNRSMPKIVNHPQQTNETFFFSQFASGWWKRNSTKSPKILLISEQMCCHLIHQIWRSPWKNPINDKIMTHDKGCSLCFQCFHCPALMDVSAFILLMLRWTQWTAVTTTWLVYQTNCYQELNSWSWLATTWEFWILFMRMYLK